MNPAEREGGGFVNPPTRPASAKNPPEVTPPPAWAYIMPVHPQNRAPKQLTKQPMEYHPPDALHDSSRHQTCVACFSMTLQLPCTC